MIFWLYFPSTFVLSHRFPENISLLLPTFLNAKDSTYQFQLSYPCTKLSPIRFVLYIWRFLIPCYSFHPHIQYKKNLKKLLIVGPSRRMRMLLFMMRPFLSKKFISKVIYIQSLSELQIHADPIQLRMPICLYRTLAPKQDYPKLARKMRIQERIESETTGIPAADGLPLFVLNLVSWLVRRGALADTGLFMTELPASLIEPLINHVAFGLCFCFVFPQHHYFTMFLFHSFFFPLSSSFFPLSLSLFCSALLFLLRYSSTDPLAVIPLDNPSALGAAATAGG